MKHRSLKLKEAHKASTGGGGRPALCSIVWDPEGRHLVTASAADQCVLIHYLDPQSKPPKALNHHKEGVTALAFSPSSNSFASGSIDHSVKLYSFPDGEFQSNVTRFTLPIRSLAFNKSGSLLAAAGDDDGIKLIATIDSTISRVLKGHKAPVTGLAFDPKNEFLASVDSVGTVIFWELSSGKLVHTLTGIAPICDSDTSLSNVLGWSPDGEILAAPGLRNDVVMYDRDTAEKLFTLKGDHERTICFLSWSPNGKYMATSGLDKQILIWDIDLRQDIERQKFDDRISGLAWKLNGNALAVIDVMGKFGVWEPTIPSCMKSPIDGAPTLQIKTDSGLLFDEDDEKPSASGSLDNVDEESDGESAPITRKRLRKQSIYEDCFGEDSDGEEGLLRQIESRKKYSDKREVGAGRREECASSIKFARPKMQEAFQPGSTPIQPAKRRFLCYNLLGSITTLENEGYSHIEVDFHDTGRGPRVPSMTDYFGFTMASLSENGSIFANPCKGDKNTSTLMYRPFSSWANNSEWSMRFEAEEIKAVALGNGWAAAATSLNFLRIFTDSGLQKHVICLNGPVVTLVGFKDELAIVTHTSDCLPSGDQVLEVTVLNIPNGTQTIINRLPLTPGSHLTWFGFSEEGHLSSYDSKGVLRMFSTQFGGSWLPIFSASKARKSEDETYWMVGLSGSKLFCIICKSPDSYPLVMPKPVLTLLSFSFPLACSDLGADDLENEFMLSNLSLSQVQNKIEEMVTAGIDATALNDEAFNIETSMDRCILKLIASCCNCDKLVRATELARLLSLEKSIKGAIKLATALKLPVLAERFDGILEERMLNKFKGTMPVSNSASIATARSNVSVCKTSPVPEFSKHQVLKPVTGEEKFSKAGGLELCKSPSKGNTVDGHHQIRSSRTVTPSAKVSPDHKKAELSHNTKVGVKQIRGVVKATEATNKEEGVNQEPSHRPVNPFAKSSKSQGKSSLFDSIKKMKVDNKKLDGSSKV
ncbi:hypothetical protein J5N97_006625 [Dioscorea zingiberensis]|uniref:Minichromosome loss protein Mcl1 middle region domain-containing protein n=1 Tax=Dioscorea zingiberensis TaxID=325984 RepID=A0A9D5DBQ4_9LILI|nr:hypothetical protein J5N97_006625 [Dioscorea zingiberensis]